jgi:hypothetical protein
MTKKNIRIALPSLTALVLLTGTSLLAQVDLSGSWAARNYGDALGVNPGPGPLPVEYFGLPLNEGGRARALLFDASQVSSPDRVCDPYASTYILMGPQGLKIWNETEPLTGSTIAWAIGGFGDMSPITIWMDGRPHPSKNALHTFTGFTTGVWEDDVLTTYTTHLKASMVRRNGAPSSDQTTMRAHWARHGDLLTVTGRIEDPVNLDGPYYMTRVFQLTGGNPTPSSGGPCTITFEGVPAGVVRHFMPGKNPFLDQVTKYYNIPVEAVLGGPETMYPEYRKKLKDSYVIPEKCPNLFFRGKDGPPSCGQVGLYGRIPQN